MEIIIQLIIIIITAIACFFAGSYRISCFFLCACIFLLLMTNVLIRKYRERQLEQMIMYLTKLQDNMELPELESINEGQLGILQSEIYKLVVLFNEQSGIAMRDKAYLANMLSDISHQIKTPIAAITIMADLLKEPELTEDKRLEFIGKIDKQVTKINWLIHNLLVLSQLDANVLKMKREKVAVSAVLKKALQPLELLAEVKGVTVLLKTSESMGNEMDIICDEEWMTEALSNIIKNCIEHTPSGGEVKIVATQSNFSTDIVIRDSGNGIAKEDLPHIFERFYKGKHGNKGSVGIGLSMAKQLIMNQNGVVSVESKEGIGSTFRVKIYSDIKM